MKLDVLKRPVVLISIGVVIVLLVVWWFAWMSPEGNKLATDNAQITTLQSTLNTDQQTLQTEKSHAQDVAQYDKLLAIFSTAVPATADAPQLIVQISDLANATGAVLQNLNVPPGPPAVTPIADIPVQFTLTGTGEQCLKFLQGIYVLPRLLTITSFTPSPVTNVANSSINVLDLKTKSKYTFNVGGLAYYSSTITSPVSSSSTTTTIAS